VAALIDRQHLVLVLTSLIYARPRNTAPLRTPETRAHRDGVLWVRKGNPLFTGQCQCQCQSGNINEAKITKSYYEDHGDVVAERAEKIYEKEVQEKIYEIGMALVVERQTARSMTGRQMVESSRGRLQQPQTGVMFI